MHTHTHTMKQKDKQNKSNLKMGKELHRHFFKEDIHIAKKQMEMLDFIMKQKSKNQKSKPQ